MLATAPVASVPVLRRGRGKDLPAPAAMVERSLAKSRRWKERLREQAERHSLEVARVVDETDRSADAEGIYVKVEAGGRVVDRLKWIRHSFLSAVAASGSHWLERPILPNMLRDGVDIFSAEL